MFGGPCSKLCPCDLKGEDHHQWVVMEGDDCNNNNDNNNNNNTNHPTSSSISSSVEDSAISSDGSSSSLETRDDASSSTSFSSSAHSTGSLYDLSDLMAQLPIKRGLSKYFQGKSESFTSLSRVTSIEDLAKKETPYRRKMKACKSYGGGLDSYKSYTLPKPIISKKTSKVSFGSSSFPGRRKRPPLIPVQKN